MSGNYEVNGNGPTVVINLAIPWRDDALVRNNGSKPVWLNDTPGIYSQGFMLPPNGGKIWHAGKGLYAQCGPGDTSVINVDMNSGEFYSPASLNVPTTIFRATNVPARDGSCPGRFAVDGAGNGPDFFSIDTTGPSPVADTGYLDVSNYATVNVSAMEVQSPVISLNREVRRVQLSWYIRLEDGTYYDVNDTYYYHYCIPLGTVSTAGVITTQPQWTAIVPAQAQFLRARIGPVVFTTPVPNGDIFYNFTVLGDNRPIRDPIEFYDSGAYYVTEFGTYNNVDMCNDDHVSGTYSVPAGTTVTLSVSHRGGPHIFSGRMLTAGGAASTAGCRMAINAIGTATTAIASSYTFPGGVTSFLNFAFPVNMPRRPCTLSLTNNNATATTMNWSLISDRQ